jgi:hypothetical protein
MVLKTTGSDIWWVAMVSIFFENIKIIITYKNRWFFHENRRFFEGF